MLLSAAIFVILVLVFRYVSLGSITAVAAFPNIALALHEYGNVALALVLMSFASRAHRRQAPRQHPPPAGRHRKPFWIEARMSEIAVIGGGAWGTGIAIVLGRKGTHRVRLWAHETDVCESIAQKRINEKFLPGRRIPDSVTATNDLAASPRRRADRRQRHAFATLPRAVRTHAPAASHRKP